MNLNRRDALRLMAGAAVLPVLSRDLFALGREVQQQLSTTPGKLRTLNPHQDATVTTIAELIIPATDTPGAKGARVNEFIDLVLTDWSDEHRRNAFVSGLDNVDARSRKLFGTDFVAASPVQQTELLTILDEELTQLREAEKLAPPPHESAAKYERKGPVEQNFFHMIKQLTLIGYYTSEVGLTQELGRPAVFMGVYQGCAPLEDSPQGAKG